MIIILADTTKNPKPTKPIHMPLTNGVANPPKKPQITSKHQNLPITTDKIHISNRVIVDIPTD